MQTSGGNWATENLLDDVNVSRYSESEVDKLSSLSGPSLSISARSANLLDEEMSDGLDSRLPLSSRTHLQAWIQAHHQNLRDRLVIAVDYGTTFTKLAFASVQGDHVELENIEVLQDWTSRMSNRISVPSAISYAPPEGNEAQWGSDISANAISMVNTKLELEPQSTRLDELDLTLQALRGMGFLRFENIRRAGPQPEYTCRLPDEIICDYLTKIAECAYRNADADRLQRTNTPIDIVATVPVGWSHNALDSLFRALRTAGFNKRTLPTLHDTILLSEPEAASYFTARFLRDRGIEFLWKGECFILCDAGGGTVDVVSYQVISVEPQLVLERATRPSGSNCGSSLIDNAFKDWLRVKIGMQNYAEIDPVNARQRRISPNAGETGAMRQIISQFNYIKAGFSGTKNLDSRLDLPPPLHRLTIEGRVNEGELTIKWNEMKQLMDFCVNEVITLITAQVDEIAQNHRRRVRNVFLVGGFGASSYLQEELQKSLDMRRMKMRRPETDKSLTAVVQGAVIYGVEKARHKYVTYMSAITRSYGIVRNTKQGLRFEWLIRRGSLVLSNQVHTIRSSEFYLTPSTPAAIFERSRQGQGPQRAVFSIYMYEPQEDEEDDDVPMRWQDGQHEVAVVGSVTCDLSNHLSQQDSAHAKSRIHGMKHSISGDHVEDMVEGSSLGPLRWQLSLSAAGIEAELLIRTSSLGRCDIEIELDCPAGQVISSNGGEDDDEID